MSSRVLTGKKIHVLIVEPSSYWRTGLKIVLSEDSELECLGEAKDGESAIRLAQELSPDVILSTTSLPDRDGIELARQIKAQFPNIKAILLGNEAEQAEIFSVVASGIPGYCFKGVSDTRLREIIKAVYEGAVWFESSGSSNIFSWFASNLENTFDLAALHQSHLTEREQEVLSLLTLGKTNDAIAQALGISVHTAKVHVCNVLSKLNVTDRVQAAVKATRACIAG